MGFSPFIAELLVHWTWSLSAPYMISVIFYVMRNTPVFHFSLFGYERLASLKFSILLLYFSPNLVWQE